MTTPQAADRELIERLRQAAQSSSRASRTIAESKSLRQTDCDPPRDDLYEWQMPEQTLEWQAADRLEALSRLAHSGPVVGESANAR